MILIVNDSELDRITLFEYVARVLADNPAPSRATPAVERDDFAFQKCVYRAARSGDPVDESEFARWTLGILIAIAIVVAIVLMLMAR